MKNIEQGTDEQGAKRISNPADGGKQGMSNIERLSLRHSLFLVHLFDIQKPVE
jgi:hypothetical protein